VSEYKWILVAVMVVAVCVASAIIIPVTINIRAGTERLKSCVEHGGSYVHVPNTGTYECQGAMIHE
jgi:hypothetical protein